MIPSALLNFIWKRSDGSEIETRVLQLWSGGFTFRLSDKYPVKEVENAASFAIHFFDFETYRYETLILEDFSVCMEKKERFYTVYRLSSQNKTFILQTEKISRQYLLYIRLCLEEEPGDMQRILTGYKGTEDEIFYHSFEEQRKETAVILESSIRDIVMDRSDQKTLGLVMEAPWQYEKFLNSGFHTYLEWFLKEVKMVKLCTVDFLKNFDKKCKLLYLGSQVCPFLFPKEEILFPMLDKIISEGKIPVIQFAPIEEWKLQETINLLGKLENWAKKEQMVLELVINDWGLLHYLRDKEYFDLTPGILLLKTKKDTRMEYKKGMAAVLEQKEKFQPGWMSGEFAGFLKKTYGIHRVSMEWSRGSLGNMPAHITIYGPWYQMNTSTGCTLKAKCETGDRGKQKRTQECIYHCKKHGFLYPKHLHMAGRYNTLFGLEMDLNVKYLPKEADRLVWNLL